MSIAPSNITSPDRIPLGHPTLYLSISRWTWAGFHFGTIVKGTAADTDEGFRVDVCFQLRRADTWEHGAGWPGRISYSSVAFRLFQAGGVGPRSQQPREATSSPMSGGSMWDFSCSDRCAVVPRRCNHSSPMSQHLQLLCHLPAFLGEVSKSLGHFPLFFFFFEVS